MSKLQSNQSMTKNDLDRLIGYAILEECDSEEYKILYTKLVHHLTKRRNN